MDLELVARGTLAKLALPAWSSVFAAPPEVTSVQNWFDGMRFNYFESMKTLRAHLLPQLLGDTPIDEMILLNIEGSGASSISKCFYTRDAVTLALGIASTTILHSQKGSRGYALARVLTSRSIAFSYCTRIDGEYRQEEFVDHLDVTGANTGLHHAIYQLVEQRAFVNLYLSSLMTQFEKPSDLYMVRER